MGRREQVVPEERGEHAKVQAKPSAAQLITGISKATQHIALPLGLSFPTYIIMRELALPAIMFCDSGFWTGVGKLWPIDQIRPAAISA